MTGYDAAAATARLAVEHEQMPLGTLLGSMAGLAASAAGAVSVAAADSRSAGGKQRLPEQHRM
jgi:hypothetical protein